MVIKGMLEKPCNSKKAAICMLDFLHGDYDLIKFYGRHAMERNMERMRFPMKAPELAAAVEPPATSIIQR